MWNEEFRTYMNGRIHDFPMMGEQTFGEYIRESLERGYRTYTPEYVSFMEMTPWGLCETIVGCKFIKIDMYHSENDIVAIQKLAVIPEDQSIDPIARNYYFGEFSMNAGFHSYGYTGRGTRFYGYMSEFRHDDSEVMRISRTQLFLAEDLIALDPSLKYFAYDGHGITAIAYIRLYRVWPQLCEMLMKFKLYRLLTDKTLDALTRDEKLGRWIAHNHKNLQGMAFQTVKNAYKKNPSGNPEDYYKSLMYRLECGRNVALRNKTLYAKVLRYTNQEKLNSYLTNNGIETGLYEDYLAAADWLQLDFSDTKVLFPRNFMEVHDNYCEQYAEHERDLEMKKGLALSKKMTATAERYGFLAAYKTAEYCVIVARNKSDLITEGRLMEHCVGKMDYDKRQAEGRSVICFIRKVENPGEPFATVEVRITDKGLSVAQCYGKKNIRLPELDGFCSSWMAHSNKERKKAS